MHIDNTFIVNIMGIKTNARHHWVFIVNIMGIKTNARHHWVDCSYHHGFMSDSG